MKILGLLALAAFLAIVALILMNVAPRVNMPAPVASSFEECAAQGNPVMESYPRQCRTPDGRIFVEEIVNQPNTPVGGSAPIIANGCAVAGCSGQLCVSAEEASTIVTTCEYRDQYACYAEASCERQANGTCGWTETTELKQCLASPPSMQNTTQTDLEVL